MTTKRILQALIEVTEGLSKGLGTGEAAGDCPANPKRGGIVAPSEARDQRHETMHHEEEARCARRQQGGGVHAYGCPACHVSTMGNCCRWV